MKPHISIITITFNSEKTVRDTFESIKRQSYENLEYIVIDGGSNDSTLEIANDYTDIITDIISEPDNGISDAMNKGIQRASGSIIGIIHSDDMLSAGALDALANSYDENTDVYFGNAIMCKVDGSELHTLMPQMDFSKFKYEFCLIHPSTFVTRNAYEKYGLYDIKLKYSMDYDLFLRFYIRGAKFKYVNYSFSKIRMGGTNQRYRNNTIDEVCQISIKHGANPFVARYVKMSKKIKDIIRPMAKLIKYKNKRILCQR